MNYNYSYHSNGRQNNIIHNHCTYNKQHKGRARVEVGVGVGVGFYTMSFDFLYALWTSLFLRANADTYALTVYHASYTLHLCMLTSSNWHVIWPFSYTADIP